MVKFRAVVEYDGTGYHGWQLQNDVPTVQGELERVLARILGTQTRVHAAGRTDAGVHARGQAIHFLADWQHGTIRLNKAMNSLLAEDVTAREVETAEPDFHARHSALSKTYIYRILNQELRSSLERLYAWHVPYLLDLGAMNEAAAAILGAHDFSAFGLATDGTASTVREMLHVQWDADTTTELLTFTICGTGFLRYMVRSLVGSMVMVGRGKMSPVGFSHILQSRDRRRAGPTAPALGLCLERVHYGTGERPKWSG